MDRAAEVLESPDRIHRPLDAVVSVASDLSPPDVLRRIVQSSIDLVGARYAAMGVLAPEGRSLQEFIYIGIDDQQRELIGDLPHGKGILGLPIKHPEPIRMPNLHHHPRPTASSSPTTSAPTSWRPSAKPSPTPPDTPTPTPSPSTETAPDSA